MAHERGTLVSGLPSRWMALSLLAVVAAAWTGVAASSSVAGDPGVLAGLSYPWGLLRVTVYGLEPGSTYGLMVLNGVGEPVEYTLIAASRGFLEPLGPVTGSLVEFTANSEAGVVLLHGLPPGGYDVVLLDSEGREVARGQAVVAPLPQPSGPPDFVVLEPGDLDVYAAASRLAEPVDYDVFANIAADRDEDGVLEIAFAGDVELTRGDAAGLGALMNNCSIAQDGVKLYSASPAGTAEISYDGHIGFRCPILLERLKVTATLVGYGRVELRYSTAVIDSRGAAIYASHSTVSAKGVIVYARVTHSRIDLSSRASCMECRLSDSTLTAFDAAVNTLIASESRMTVFNSTFGTIVMLDYSHLDASTSIVDTLRVVDSPSAITARGLIIHTLRADRAVTVEVHPPGLNILSLNILESQARLLVKLTTVTARVSGPYFEWVRVEGFGDFIEVVGAGLLATLTPNGMEASVAPVSEYSRIVEASVHALHVVGGEIGCGTCRAEVVVVECDSTLKSWELEAGNLTVKGGVEAQVLRTGLIAAPNGSCPDAAAPRVVFSSLHAPNGKLRIAGPPAGAVPLRVAGTALALELVEVRGSVEASVVVEEAPPSPTLRVEAPGGGVFEASVLLFEAGFRFDFNLSTAGDPEVDVDAGESIVLVSCSEWGRASLSAKSIAMGGCHASIVEVESVNLAAGVWGLRAGTAVLASSNISGTIVVNGALELRGLHDGTVVLEDAAVEAGSVVADARVLRLVAVSLNAGELSVPGLLDADSSVVNVTRLEAPMVFLVNTTLGPLSLGSPMGWNVVYAETSSLEVSLENPDTLIIASSSRVKFSVGGCERGIVVIGPPSRGGGLTTVIGGANCTAYLTRSRPVVLAEGGTARLASWLTLSSREPLVGVLLASHRLAFAASTGEIALTVNASMDNPRCLDITLHGGVKTIVNAMAGTLKTSIGPGLASINYGVDCQIPAPGTVVIVSPTQPLETSGTTTTTAPPPACTPANVTITVESPVVSTTTLTVTETRTIPCNETQTPQTPPGGMEEWEAAAALALLGGVAAGAVLPAVAARLRR